MRAKDYKVLESEMAGWPVRITSYRIGGTWHAKADNVSPGATIATSRAATEQAALEAVMGKARARLAATRRFPASAEGRE